MIPNKISWMCHYKAQNEGLQNYNETNIGKHSGKDYELCIEATILVSWLYLELNLNGQNFLLKPFRSLFIIKKT